MDEEILIVASGNVVHNLGAMNWGATNEGFDWAHRFDDDARSIMKSNPLTLAELNDHDDFRLAVPTSEHFLPLAYIAGIAGSTGSDVNVFAEGCVMGSLSMTSYSVS